MTDEFDFSGRLTRLSEQLISRIDPYVLGDHHGFERRAFEETQVLRQQMMGPQLLSLIGEEEEEDNESVFFFA